MSFSAFKFSEPLLRAIEASGYSTPTPIQRQTIPAVLSGRDVMASAETGTGKTACFALPLLQRLSHRPKVGSNQIRALILTPTRELAVQVQQSIAAYGKHLPLKSAVVYGGVKINPQMMKLRAGIDVLVATPGRLLDLAAQNAVKFNQVETLVLDEADRMLDMGFSDEIAKILARLPKQRQNLLFSATFSDEIRTLSAALLNNPLEVDVSPRNSAAQSIKQSAIEIDKGKKTALLCHLIQSHNWQQVLVFTRTKKGADRLVRDLHSEKISAAAIHGDKSQSARSRALSDFKAKNLRILVATDLAARGLDINELPQVINFDLPKVAADYIHRIGRTGRAGSQGQGISLVSADDVKMLAAIESLIKLTLVREVVSGFIPTHNVPLTRQTPVKPKKPKKQKQGQQPGEAQTQQVTANGKRRRGGKGTTSRSTIKGTAGKAAAPRPRKHGPAKGKPGGQR